MRRTTAAPSTTRLHGDGGAVLVEAALVGPLFVLVIFGLIEFGGAYRDTLTLANASVGGTRQAAISGNAADADWDIIQAVKRANTAMPASQLTEIVIFRATGPNGTVPTACLTGPVIGLCNVFDQASLALTAEPEEWNDCGGPTGDYCSTSRTVTVGAPGPDYVGVYVRAVHPWITGFFGKQVTLTDCSITRLEPRKL
jgi:Flp pilus assembly protein TadG